MSDDDILEIAHGDEHIIIFHDNAPDSDIIKFARTIAAKEREDSAKFFDMNDTNLFWGSAAASHIRARGE